MILIILLVAVAAVWVWVHFATPPAHARKLYYRQSLARPVWAKGVRGEAHEFVNWVGVPDVIWDTDILPSIEIVKASLKLVPLARAHEVFPRAVDGEPALTTAVRAIWAVHKLAGAAIAKEDVVRHAMHTYHHDGFAADAELAIRTFIETRADVFSADVAPGLQNLHRGLQAAFAIRVAPLPPARPPGSEQLGPTLSEDHRKAE